MDCYYGGQNYDTWLIVMANIDILYGTTETLRSTVKVLYKWYLSQGIKYTKNLLYDKTNIDSFDISEGEKSLNSNFLTLTGLRHAVPLNLRAHPHSFTVILDMENFKCRNYYSLLIKFKYEKPMKWAKMKEEFNLEDKCISEAFSLPINVRSEPYLRSL